MRNSAVKSAIDIPSDLVSRRPLLRYSKAYIPVIASFSKWIRKNVFFYRDPPEKVKVTISTALFRTDAEWKRIVNPGGE